MSNIYHVMVEGGWRSVDFCSVAVQPDYVVVRDRYRGEYLCVRESELIPVVPRSQWEVQDAK